MTKSNNAPAKCEVLGVGVSTTNYREVARTCAEWVSHRRASGAAGQPARYICVTSVHGVMEARKDPGIRSILNNADIATPDGMPLVWALRSFGVSGQTRVYGPDLMLALCDQGAREGHRVFLYGGRPETLSLLQSNLLARYPGLNIVGAWSPPFRDLTAEEEEELRKMVLEADPDLLFVGISTPRQERWMAAHRKLFPGVIMIGVGAAFDFHAGRVAQAPAWMQRSGLEWFFRLTREPRRLWKRYVLVTPWFIPFWAFQKASIFMRQVACGPGSKSTDVKQTGEEYGL